VCLSPDEDDWVKREYIPVPIPVPVFIPVPMNLYAQVTPMPITLPVPVRNALGSMEPIELSQKCKFGHFKQRFVR
jgi:hypothetical protein